MSSAMDLNHMFFGRCALRSARADPGKLPAAEARCLPMRAGPKRRREFAAGRAAARAALRQMHPHPGPVLADLSGRPIWPRGIVGSLSHSGTNALCVVARSSVYAGLGIDVEGAEPLERAFWPTAFGPAERQWLTQQSGAEHLAKQLFCAKEAAFKALAPAAQKGISFTDMPVRLCVERGLFRAQASGLGDSAQGDNIQGDQIRGDQIRGRLIQQEGEIIALAYRLRTTTTPARQRCQPHRFERVL